MEEKSFEEQFLSIMEILAKTAAAEIKRRVENSCAHLHLQISTNEREIHSLKHRYHSIENQLRKNRGKARKRVFICRTSEKLPEPFPAVWVRDAGTDVCRAEQTISPQEADPGQSAQHIHQSVQMLEDMPKVPVIKEEGTENETWSNGEGNFPFEHPDREPHHSSQENHEAQNQLHESIHFTRLPPVEPGKSDEEGLSKLKLQVKAEEDQEEEEKEEHEAMVEGFQERMEEAGDHLEFAVEQRDARLWQQQENDDSRSEWTDRCFTSAQIPHDHAVFSQPVEHAGEDSHPSEDPQMELYGAGQVSAQKQQLQVSWRRDRHQDSSAAKERNSQRNSQQHRRTPQGPGEPGMGAGMSSQTGSSMPTQPLSGYRRLRTHWRTNTSGERRFSCSYCERRFVRFGQLKEHLRSHTGERPYACAQCGRSFTKQGNLIRHAVVHSGEKPYQCGLCGKRFTQRSSLKSHQKTHVPDRDDALQGLAAYQPGTNLSLTQGRGFV